MGTRTKLARSSRIVLHDYYDRAEGGGRLALTLADGLQTDLAYGFKTRCHPYFERYHPAREIDLSVRPRWPWVRQQRLIGAFAGRDIATDYDIAIYSGAYSPLATQAGGAGFDLLYCHTPPRFAYDQREQMLACLPRWQRRLAGIAIDRYRERYQKAVSSMDAILCNSHNVQRRIANQLGRSARVVPPPCDTGWFRWLGQGDYYLSTARLDPLKRVDLIVQAFKCMPQQKLIVTSDGSERCRLQRLAEGTENIRFTGPVDEDRLRKLIGHAIATLYLPVDEDFGMSPVESMAAGKPVIGIKEGGLLETLIDGETGILLDPPPRIEAIVEAVRGLTPARARTLRGRCERQAEQFSVGRFLASVQATIADLPVQRG